MGKNKGFVIIQYCFIAHTEAEDLFKEIVLSNVPLSPFLMVLHISDLILYINFHTILIY